VTAHDQQRPLRISLLTYRGNPTSGGQGVYVQHLSKALLDLGHQVEVLSGPPYPHLDSKIKLHRLPSLDLYNSEHLFKVKKIRDLASPLNMYEFLNMCTGSFPEPYTFGVRAHRYLQSRHHRYDIIHDNQCLSYGIGMIAKCGIPTIATIHHPITVDREEELKAARSLLHKIKIRRWYSFIKMQKRVARKLSHIITVSECAKKDIAEEFSIELSRFRVIPNGVNVEYFYPVPNPVRPDNSLIVTNSADIPLKGLRYLLEAVAQIKDKRHVQLTVIGEPKKNSAVKKLVGKLGIGDFVHFTGRIKNEEFAQYYAKATIAVVPSLYEGFGIPAAEAMACGVPLITTSGGALPEVVGDAGIIVPPADSAALAKAIIYLLDNKRARNKFAEAGIKRVNSVFSWPRAAKAVVGVYREAINAHGRFS
jgi:glycosyltransferase involved in cell wall biosynthesis